ncbi:MAG: TRAP transporter small permease [Burkholderiales bacterium]|nr:TRAP transporter small permease [Burkholderiales bacterium]
MSAVHPRAPRRPAAWARVSAWLADAVAAAMLLALSAVTVVDVVGRYLFRAPIGGADELTVFFMAIGVYAVLPRLSWREEHTCVDIIDVLYRGRWIAPRQTVLNALAAAFMAMVTWRMWILAGRLTGDGEVTMFLRLQKGPLVYFFAAMCAAAALALAGNAVRYALGRGPLSSGGADAGR